MMSGRIGFDLLDVASPAEVGNMLRSQGLIDLGEYFQCVGTVLRAFEALCFDGAAAARIYSLRGIMMFARDEKNMRGAVNRVLNAYTAGEGYGFIEHFDAGSVLDACDSLIDHWDTGRNLLLESMARGLRYSTLKRSLH